MSALRSQLAVLAMVGLGLFATACGASTSRTGTLQQSGVGFSCRLPVGSESGDFGGFVSFPEGTFQRVSGSSITFDAVHERWLPVGHQMLSPDSRSYVYAQDTNLTIRRSSHSADGMRRWRSPFSTSSFVFILRRSSG